MHVVVCLKWVPRRVVVDPATATFELDPRTFGPSPADLTALEIALSLAIDDEDSVTVVCAGPETSDAMLRDALAMGADRAVWCPADPDAGSAAVAAALAVVCQEADLVLCGDHSTDRGSGSVPAFIAAELDAAQALGIVGLRRSIDLVVDPSGGRSSGVGASEDQGSVIAERRLDRGRRAVLAVPFPAVISVEGSATFDGVSTTPRRAPLSGVIAARTAAVEPGPTVRERRRLTTSAVRAHRPRTKPRPAPSDAPPHVRILDITRATEDREPPKTVHLDPAAAADATIEALSAWGYLDRPDPTT